MKPLLSIQYLRAAAALGVVGYHAAQWRSGGFDVGRAGVDLFFVISGVIMWKVTGTNEGSPSAFVWRRFTRVAPFYWLVTLAMTGVALAWPMVLANIHPAVGHVFLSLAFIPHLDPKGLPFPLLAPGWSLNYEAIFYLVFAAALFAPRRRQAAFVCGGLFLIVAAGFILDDPIYILGANPMLFQFAAGVAIANLAEMGALPGRRGGWGLIALGIAALALPAMLGLFSEFWRPFIWGIPAALIVAGALAVEDDGGTPRLLALAALGDASYALYLIHEPAEALVGHVLGAAPAWLFYPTAIATSVAAALACHRWIERPLTAWARSVFRPGRGSADGRTEPGRSPPSPSRAGKVW
ncbi:MAG TPA: acyltransferase [Caulobacteraceae bacterium]